MNHKLPLPRALRLAVHAKLVEALDQAVRGAVGIDPEDWDTDAVIADSRAYCNDEIDMVIDSIETQLEYSFGGLR